MNLKRYNTKIDVIIPAYNVADEILHRCLASIACQQNVDDLEVTIVDDASTKQNYQAIADLFKDFLKIKIIRYEKNGGPGVARQYGIDHTSNGYITFIDADDTFYGPLALTFLKEGLEANITFQACFASFYEINTDLTLLNQSPLVVHQNDRVWVFGKIYRRRFIDINNIRFHPTSRANEDNGFNTAFWLCCQENEINVIPQIVYCWHENVNSITRIDNGIYHYGTSINHSFGGYVENMIYALNTAFNAQPYNGNILFYAVDIMIHIYNYYLGNLQNSPETAEENLKWCKKYYNEIYKNLTGVNRKYLINQFSILTKSAYQGDQLEFLIPQITFDDFIKQLEKE